ncbi:DNA polymerase IV [Saccharibacillus sp. CPCC 101409]|uniref:DNA polymerase IV n=1 Tax=Saccharibacillus sp. CPCC 101409 TaxID=3058041 RepID=UPI002672A4A4|nr:DNA polymerase IV [Saccharibacillus sp. CPCC 101409]MDO3411891.1 DNA polymerase IV [Saccharibacillus sp. CPCC 101409]
MPGRKRVIMLIDMESFYAGIEKARRPEYRNMPLVVAGDPSVPSSAVLAACPIAKRHDIRTGERLSIALSKCPDLVAVRPRMAEYIEVSAQIAGIVEAYTDLVEPYSIDEMFADFTGTLHLYGGGPEELAKLVQQRIAIETGVRARFGIGSSKVLAKLACDLVAKRTDDGIFTLHTRELESAIWNEPVRRMWGVGRRMERKLHALRIMTIGDLARTPLSRLRAKWGVNGEVLWRTANGLDDSPVQPWAAGETKEVGTTITLPRAYRGAREIETVLLDLCTEIGRRARRMRRMGGTLSLGVGGESGRAGSFRRRMRLPEPSDITSELHAAARTLFREGWSGLPVKRIGLSLSGLVRADVYQLSLLDLEGRERQRAIDAAMDEIKDRFGETAIVRGSSFTEAGRAKDRAGKIGGHYK